LIVSITKQGAKVEVLGINVVKNRHFDRFLKGWESRPAGESDCEAMNRLLDNDRLEDRSRVEQEKPRKLAAGVTLKAETQLLTMHSEQAKRSAEEWTNQWRVWTGDTLRSHMNNTIHTVRGDGTSQKRKADKIDPAQRYLTARVTEAAHWESLIVQGGVGLSVTVRLE